MYAGDIKLLTEPCIGCGGFVYQVDIDSSGHMIACPRCQSLRFKYFPEDLFDLGNPVWNKDHSEALEAVTKKHLDSMYVELRFCP